MMVAVNVAVLGYGLSAKVFHIPFILTTSGLRLHSIVQRSPTSGNSASSDHPGVQVFTSIQDLYSSPGWEDIGLVVVSTSNNTHFQYAREAIESGKNVVVEKPFCTTSSDAKALVKLAEERRVVVAPYQSLFSPSTVMTKN